MTQTNQNLTHWRGNSHTIKFVSSADLTSTVMVRYWLSKKVTSTGADILVMKSTNPGEGITLDISGGLIAISLDPDDTEDVPAGNYYHECELIDNQDRVTTLFIGKIQINPVLIPSDLDDVP